ncbi:MAG: Crp/Fnr family transcriptional regulator [Anaerolineae bacterium]|nr:Crp/Fnr family transcriptional regulator [Anaerolineae bacterium]
MLELDDLRTIPLFQDLNAEQLRWLGDHLRIQEFPAGCNIALAEQPGEIVYIIVKGTLKTYVQQTDGTEVILAILGPGDTVGEISLLDRAGRSANVVTMEKATLLWMDQATFWKCLQTMPAVTYKLAQILCGRLRLGNEQIKALAGLDIYGRVARQLLAMAEQYGQPTANGATLIPIRLTQSDIAGLIGASRESVNQVMVIFKKEKYISVDKKFRIAIHNEAALRQSCLL